MISVGEGTSMAKTIVEAKQTKAAKAKAARVLKAEQRDQAMLALSEKRYKLLGEDAIRECLKQQDKARKAANCQRTGSIFP
jgi:hypothetical protein